MKIGKEVNGRREMAQEQTNTRRYQGRRIAGEKAPVEEQSCRCEAQSNGNKKSHKAVWVVLLCVAVLGTAVVYYMLCIHPYRDQGVFSGIDLTEHVALGNYKTVKNKTYTEEGAALKNRVWHDILQEATLVQCPENVLDDYFADDIAYQERLARDYGYETLEAFALAQYGKTLEEFKEYLRGYAREDVFSDMVAYAIAKEEGLLFTEEAYAQRLRQFVDDKGMTEEEFELNYGCSPEKYAREQNLEPGFLKEHIVAALLSQQEGGS